MESKEKRHAELFESLRGKERIGVLFVCLGNICRSPAAEGVFRTIVESHGDSARFDIDSAGTQGYHAGDLPDPRMRMHARRRGLELNHICRKVTPSDFDEFDVIVGMDASNLTRLREAAPTVEAVRKIVGMGDFLTGVSARWDHVPDPYYDGAEGFELVLDLLENGCENLYQSLRGCLK